jgi:hypothetical protein
MLITDDERLRRRALAARAVLLAPSLRLAQEGGRDLGVPCPEPVTPDGLIRWAGDLERGYATVHVLGAMRW